MNEGFKSFTLIFFKIGPPGTLAKEKKMYQFYKPNW